MKKKFLALVMTLSMVLSLVPMTALAAGDNQVDTVAAGSQSASEGANGGSQESDSKADSSSTTTSGEDNTNTNNGNNGNTGSEPGSTGGTESGDSSTSGTEGSGSTPSGGGTGGGTGGTNNSTEEKDPPAKPEGVAKIGETYYQSMKDAFKAAKPGDTIELQEDITFWEKKDSLEVKVSKNFDGELTIDLNDHYIDGNNVDKCIWRTGTTDCWPSKLTVKNGTLKNGDAASSSGGAIQWQGDLAIENCKFENNDNCAIVVLKGKVDILKSSFTGNETRKTRRLSGAAIQITENQGTNIRDSVFSGNTVNEGYSMGGAVYVDHNSVDITGCTFEGNSAPYGGAIAAAKANVTIGEDTKFLNNTATSMGGAIYIQNIRSDSSALTLNGPITVTGNRALYGGAISATGSTVTIGEGSKFSSNIATSMGGAIYIQNGDNTLSTLRLNELITMTGNQASYGGAIYANNANMINVAKSATLYNNVATQAGDDLFLNGATFTLPNAKEMGGSRILTSDSEEITGWYHDGWKKWNAAANDSKGEYEPIDRWTAETADEYIPMENDTQAITLKAAHPLMYTLTYNVTGDAPEGYTAPAKQTLKANEKYTVAEVPASVSGTKEGVNGTYSFSGWKTADGTTLTGEQELTGDITLYGVWAFTKTPTGGGGGGSHKPTVTIPDDVPTGLNGKDHYAYVVGYPDGMVYPQKNITRAEVATIFFRLLTDETREANMTKSNSYNDMKNGAWYTCAVSTLSKMGIIKGYEDGSFKPDASISRAEFAAIAARFDPDGDKTPATFSDVSSHWAKDEISIAANHGWIKGYEDGSFKPDQKITRAETMTLVNRVLKRLPETKDDLHKDMKTWPDNQNESAWFYLAVQEATNSHYQKLKKDGTHETWESMRETRDWAALEK